ncbi:MAG: hypothetical protein Q4B99_01670 [Clostridia bacterium]|nr:hypothetical protein [Clostridia bacterium]
MGKNKFKRLSGIRRLPRGKFGSSLKRSNAAPFLALLGIILALLAVAALVIYVLLPAVMPYFGREYYPPLVPTPTPEPTPRPTPTPHPMESFEPFEGATEVVIDGTDYRWFADPYFYDGTIVFSGGYLVDGDVRLNTLFMYDALDGTYEQFDYTPAYDHLFYPQLNEDWLVLLDAGAAGGGQIVAFDRHSSSNTPIIVKDVYVGQPEIKLDGNYLVWTERTGTRMDKLFVCDLTTLETTTLAMFQNSVFGQSIPSSMNGLIVWAVSDTALEDEDSNAVISYIRINGGSMQSFAPGTYVHDPEGNGAYFCWLDSHHAQGAKLYAAKGPTDPFLVAEDVTEFALFNDYVVYGVGETVWLHSFTTGEKYQLTPDDKAAQFIGVSNGMAFWMNVSARGRDIIEYLALP